MQSRSGQIRGTAAVAVAGILCAGLLLPRAETDSAAAPVRTEVWALGDGADGSKRSRALARFVKSRDPERFFYLGDVYDSGTAAEFRDNYQPLYGSMAGRTDPVIGNHEYPNRVGGYYAYWRSKRGWTRQRAKHRSYVDGSGWQVIAYSSETDMVEEGRWVGRQLAKHSGTCRIAIGHKGRHVVTDTAAGDNPGQEPVWSRLAGRVAINLVGHTHLYGRLKPLRGVTVLVSGAGGHAPRRRGAQHHPVARTKGGVATATRLILRRGAADYRQVDASGRVYDSGTVRCKPAG